MQNALNNDVFHLQGVILIRWSMNSFMEYPLPTNTNPYTNRDILHNLPPSPVLDGSMTSQGYNSCVLDSDRSNIRLNHEVSTTQNGTSPIRSSPDLSPGITNNDQVYQPPYTNGLSYNASYYGAIASTTTNQMYLAQHYAANEAYSPTNTLYNGTFHANGRPLYPQYNVATPLSTGALAGDDVVTSLTSTRRHEQSSPPVNALDLGQTNATTPNETNANTYDWMKIKRNPPKNGWYLSFLLS